MKAIFGFVGAYLCHSGGNKNRSNERKSDANERVVLVFVGAKTERKNRSSRTKLYASAFFFVLVPVRAIVGEY